jgi:cell shape-determining protein MreD
MWPALLVAVALPSQQRHWIVAALVAGLAWDSTSGIAGPATLSLLVASLLARNIEQQLLPARGSTAVAALAAGMVVATQCVLFVLVGFSSPGVPAAWWLVEAACTGILAGAVYWMASSVYGRRSI